MPDTFSKNLAENNILIFGPFCWYGICLHFVLTCLFVSQPSLSFTLHRPPPHADPQAGGPQRRSPPPARERGVDRAAIAQRLPPPTSLPRASHQSLLPQFEQEELR